MLGGLFGWFTAQLLGRAQDQQRVALELGHLVSSLRAFGFAWLKVPPEAEHHFRQLHQAQSTATI